jgi:hypothetical protein
MLTDLSFIQTGKPWKPEDKDERDRLAEHEKNRKLYNGEHEAVFPKFAAYLKDKIDDDKKVAIIIGLAKTATKEYINFLIGEAPEIKAPVVYETPDYEVITDASRDGIGLFEITQDGIVAQNPENCYMVVTPGNIRKVQAYVFFHEFEQESSGKKLNYVKFTIHQPGTIQHLVYEVKDGKLGDPQSLASFPQFAGLKVDGEGRQSPGVDELLVVRIDNILTSDRYYGQSDYTPEIYSKLEALDLAFSRRAEVLAKFSRPKPMAPLGAFNFDHAKKKYTWKTEDAIIVEKDEPPAQYLTWQAQLEDVQKEIDGLYKQLLKDFALTDDDEVNKAESGTAIRLKQSETLAKVRWLASSYKKAVAQALSLKSKLDMALEVPNAQAFEPSDVQVQLKDGIPEDPMETAQIAAIWDAMGALSLERKLVLQGLKEGTEAFEKELQRLRAAQPAAPESPEALPQIELLPLAEEG